MTLYDIILYDFLGTLISFVFFEIMFLKSFQCF